MERNQQYLTNLLYKVPSWELPDPQQQDMFEKIRVSLSNTTDFPGQLKSLYRVSSLADLALGLMWIADKVDRDPSRLESTAEEEAFVLNLLRAALSGSPVGSDAGFGLEPTPQPPQQEISSAQQPSGVGSPEFGKAKTPPAAGGASKNVGEEEFSTTLDELVEAIQGGSEERTGLIDELTRQAEAVAGSSSAEIEYKTFCGYLIEFLKYASTYELFDDIRVMNLLSNVYDPFSQWAKADPAARSGILEQTNETLRDFKALFE
jgi:hypothetical protein